MCAGMAYNKGSTARQSLAQADRRESAIPRRRRRTASEGAVGKFSRKEVKKPAKFYSGNIKANKCSFFGKIDLFAKKKRKIGRNILKMDLHF